jgi:ferrous iron transport protein A
MQLRHKAINSKKTSCETTGLGQPIVDLKEGSVALIAHAGGDENVVRRLSEMGLTPGSEVKLLRKCSFRGPVEIEVRGVALALGYELASEICVQPLKANPHDD